MNKYEQLIEHIINDDTDKARELFHNIVVEKSRDIYESLIDEEDLNEVGGNQVEELADEVTCDEQGLSEEEEEGEEASEFDSEEGEYDHHADVGGEEELEDRVVDLESALDELKAEFDALMADEAGEEEHQDGMNDPEFGDAVEVGGEEEVFEAEEEDEEDEEDLEESIVREYVEKVADQGQKTEGGEVAAGKTANVNKQSTVAGKNDMGGSAKNIATGKAGADVTAEKTKGQLIGKVQNTAGGSKSLSAATKAKAGEGQTTGQTVGGVNTKSPLAK